MQADALLQLAAGTAITLMTHCKASASNLFPQGFCLVGCGCLQVSKRGGQDLCPQEVLLSGNPSAITPAYKPSPQHPLGRLCLALHRSQLLQWTLAPTLVSWLLQLNKQNTWCEPSLPRGLLQRSTPGYPCV